MNTWQTVFIVVNSLASLAVLWSAICATNNMSRKTPASLRLAFVLLGIGGFAALLTPAYLNRVPTAAETLLCLGIAILSLVDRRRVRQKRLAGH